MLTDSNFADQIQGAVGGISYDPAPADLYWTGMEALYSSSTAAAPTTEGNNITGSNNSSVTVRKRRTVDENYPALLRKSASEKRRREQENVYIDELAELVSISISEVGSEPLKADKTAILQDAVNQIRRFRAEQEVEHGSTSNRPVEPTGQGEIPASRDSALDTKVLANYLLDALDGFLFVLSSEGMVGYVSDNVDEYLKVQAKDMIGKSIFNFIDIGDQNKFSTTILQGNSASSESGSIHSTSRQLNCRFSGSLSSIAENVSNVVDDTTTLQVSAVQHPHYDPDDATGPGGLICVARRIDHLTQEYVEQFTTRLDLNGRILAVDLRGNTNTYREMVHHFLHELCHPDDANLLSRRFKEAVVLWKSVTPVYWMQLVPPGYCRVQTKFTRCPRQPPKQDFIMATHSVITGKTCSSTSSPAGQEPASVSLPSLLETVELNPGTTNDPTLSDFNLDLFPASTWGPVTQTVVSRTTIGKLQTSPSLVDEIPSLNPVQNPPCSSSPGSEKERPRTLENPGNADSKLRGLLTQKNPAGSTSRDKEDSVISMLLESSPKESTSYKGTDMLLSLLNRKSSEEEPKSDQDLLKSLGFPSPIKPTTPQVQESKTSESKSQRSQDPLNLFGPDERPVPCTAGSSDLLRKNKMLASLLAKDPMEPPVPISALSLNPSSLPQEKLPKDLKLKIMQVPARGWAGGSVHSSQDRPGESGSFLNTLLSNKKSEAQKTRRRRSKSDDPTQKFHQDRPALRTMEPIPVPNPPPFGPTRSLGMVSQPPPPLPPPPAPPPPQAPTPAAGDTLLSEILDQIIEMDPNYDPSSGVSLGNDDVIRDLIDQLTAIPATAAPPPPPPLPQQQPDTAAIDVIERTLMSFETPGTVGEVHGYRAGFATQVTQINPSQLRPAVLPLYSEAQSSVRVSQEPFGINQDLFRINRTCSTSSEPEILPHSSSPHYLSPGTSLMDPSPFPSWFPQQQVPVTAPKRNPGMVWHPVSSVPGPPPQVAAPAAPPALPCYGAKPKVYTQSSRRAAKSPKAPREKKSQVLANPYFPPGSSAQPLVDPRPSYNARIVSFEQSPGTLNPQPVLSSPFSLSLDSARNSAQATNQQLAYTSGSLSSLGVSTYSRTERPAGNIFTQPGLGPTLTSSDRGLAAPLMSVGDPLDTDDLEALRLSLELSQNPGNPVTEAKSFWLTPELQPADQSKGKPGIESGTSTAEPKMSLLQKLLSE